ncbi:MAG: exodeoxyribonuclease V subunit gamma, partial [Deltaproteobacteria bacterium]|nr:exodeoxyribonuclease V subunit gamma [Deltaproteobacteria bacterium]
MYSVLVIYPTAHKVENLLKRESQGKEGLFGHRVMTFPQLTDALWREAGIARMTIGPVGEWLALEEAVTRARTRGIDLALVPGDGVRDHLLRFIRELKSAAIGAGDLRQACAGLADTAAVRAGDAAEIFAEYDNLLREAGVADAHDCERLVVEWLHRMEEAGQRPRYLNGIEHVLVAEIYDPSLLQFMLVSSLIRLIGDATLTIQAEPFDLRVSRFADLTWNRFVAEESISDKVLPHFVRRDGRTGRLGFVLTHLFAQAAPASVIDCQPASPGEEYEMGDQELAASGVELPPPDGTVRIIEAPNQSREAEEVARAIRRMLELPAAEQIRLDRIAIVARNLQTYRNHLEAAFRRYRLPLNVSGRQPLSAFAPARVVRDILRIPAQNYHRDSMLSLCRAPFVQFAAVRYPEFPVQAGYIDRETRPLAACIESRRAELS